MGTAFKQRFRIALTIIRNCLRVFIIFASSNKVIVRPIHEWEIAKMPKWIHDIEGWVTSEKFLRIVYGMDPSGWILAHHPNHGIIGNIWAINMDDKYAFGGFFLVVKKFRRNGIGQMLWEDRKRHIGDRLLHVNAISTRLKQNLNLGMTFPEFKLMVMVGHLNHIVCARTLKLWKVSQHVGMTKCVGANCRAVSKISYIPLNTRNVTHEVFEKLRVYDTNILGLDREAYLIQHIFDLDAYEKGGIIAVLAIESAENLLDNQQLLKNVGDSPKIEGDSGIRGFGMLCERFKGYAISPLYAQNEEIARGILLNLLGSQRIRQNLKNSTQPYTFECEITVKASTVKNSEFGSLLKGMGFELFSDLYRMHYHRNLSDKEGQTETFIPPVIPTKLDQVYAFTSADCYLA